jgi:hypothetical protein
LSIFEKVFFSGLFIAVQVFVWAALMALKPAILGTGVVFYDGILVALLATFLGGLALWVLKKPLDLFLRLLLLSNSLVIIMLFLVLGPVAIERSLSLFLLSEVRSRGGQVSEIQFESLVSHEYPQKMQVSEQRIREQIASGNLEKMLDGNLRITDGGYRVLAVTGWVRRIFGLRRLD